METFTQQTDMGKALQDAVLQQAVDAGYASSEAAKKAGNEGQGGQGRNVSPKNGAVLPQGKGRPPGVRNKLVNLRDAVLEAFDMAGGAQYLYQLSQGTSSDRAAFTGLVAKVLPTQINANVEGGIQVQLSWLGSRSIGTTTAQTIEPVTQVVDLERDSGGKYRIKDQAPAQDGGEAAGQGDTGADKA